MEPVTPFSPETPSPAAVEALAARYGEKMRAIQATDELRERVLQRARAQSAPANAAHEGRLRRPLRFAIAACLTMLAGIGALAALSSAPSDAQPLSFVVRAYGSDEKAVIPKGAQGLVVLDSATKVPSYRAVDEESHATYGLYTGCEFHVEGDDIARVQAHLDRGEIYQVETVSYTPASDPDLAKALASWKPGLRFYDDLTAKYDLVEDVMYDKTLGEANEGRIKGDPDTLVKQNLYQRLGPTIDFDAESAEERPRADGSPLPLTERTFGLWTNLPFDVLSHEEVLAQGGDAATLDERNREAALETLDGARLTVTVTFTDGSLATQTIDLHTADFKANVIARVNGAAVVEATSTMLEGTAKELPRADGNSKVGDEASVRTIYGLIVEETAEPFAFGDATRSDLDGPRTPVELIYENAEDSSSEAHERADEQRLQNAPWSPLAREDLLQGSASYRATTRHTDNNATSEYGRVTIEGAQVLSALPEEIASLSDMFAYYANGGTYDTTLDHITDERAGYTIANDGTLTPGFSYVLLTQTLENTGFHPAEISLCSGMFHAVEEDPADPTMLRTKMLDTTETPLWRSSHDGPGWDAHFMFQVLPPGEKQTIQLLYVLPDAVLQDDRLGYHYHDPELAPRDRVLHLGALLP